MVTVDRKMKIMKRTPLVKSALFLIGVAALFTAINDDVSLVSSLGGRADYCVHSSGLADTISV